MWLECSAARRLCVCSNLAKGTSSVWGRHQGPCAALPAVDCVGRKVCGVLRCAQTQTCCTTPRVVVVAVLLCCRTWCQRWAAFSTGWTAKATRSSRGARTTTRMAAVAVEQVVEVVEAVVEGAARGAGGEEVVEVAALLLMVLVVRVTTQEVVEVAALQHQGPKQQQQQEQKAGRASVPVAMQRPSQINSSSSRWARVRGAAASCCC